CTLPLLTLVAIFLFVSCYHPNSLVFLFFFLTRRPPTPTLFPYTTLFRSYAVSDRRKLHSKVVWEIPNFLAASREQKPLSRSLCRSEEHTSELQSRFDLVCRLLLEKKKQERQEQLHLETEKKCRAGGARVE